MTARQRFLAWARREPLDRLPVAFGWPRGSTLAAWRRQGLTPELERRFYGWCGYDPWLGFGKFDTGPIPAFEVRVIAEHGNQREWVDEWGVRRIDAIRQPTAGFATRQYLEFPVKGLADFEAMAFRYDPATPQRLTPVPGENNRPTYNPDGYRVSNATTAWRHPEHLRQLNEGDAPTTLTVPGLYWTARDWAGFEGLSELFYTDPACVEAMMEHWTGFIVTALEGPLSQARIDRVILNEDMAYKHAAMLSPAMMRRFMVPRYRRLYEFFKTKGVTQVLMDSDGHLGQVLDVFCDQERVIDGATPVEIASHNDPGVFLERWPEVFLDGGIDKRELRGDLGQARAEVVRRYRQAHRFGRYLPGVDHGVPPDVPLRTFLYSVELAHGLARGEDPERFEPAGELTAALGPLEELFDPLKAIREAAGDNIESL
jgi:uroporphyrinogen decarboxylase